MSLKNKVAIVTGGNSGIGQAIVLELARQEASIVIDYVVHPEATAALEQQIAKLGDQSISVNADVSKLDDLRKLVDAAVEKDRIFSGSFCSWRMDARTLALKSALSVIVMRPTVSALRCFQTSSSGLRSGE